MKLTEKRKSNNLTQKELAAKSGVPIKTLQHYEQRTKDINKASVDTVYHLAKALDCQIEDLIDL